MAHAALAGLLLAACKDVEQRHAAAGPNDVGGTMVIAQPAEPATLLPAIVTLSTDSRSPICCTIASPRSATT